MNLRISDYFERGKKIKIIVNEKTLEAFEGECLSIVLFISNHKNLRLSPKKKNDLWALQIYQNSNKYLVCCRRQYIFFHLVKSLHRN